jgi:Zn-dependent peptidase ImmA (M78 family)
MNYLGKQFAISQAESDLLAFMQKIGQNCFPVDPAFVADVLWGTGVIYLNEGELEGDALAFALLEENQIVIEECGYEPRNRFSTAHEVGHISLHRHLSKLGEIKERYLKFCEFQADAYASTLLMPRLAVLHFMNTETGMLESDSDKIFLVKDYFYVSAESARIRLEELNLNQNPNMHKQVAVYEKGQQLEREFWFTDQ